MKILFYIESLHSGGKERRLVELIKALSNDSSYKMEVVLTKKGIHYFDSFPRNIKIHYTLRKERKKKDISVFYNFYKIAKMFNPDIIHVWSNLTAIYAVPAKMFLKIPLINNQITNTTHHGSGSILSHKLTFPFSDKIIANTHAGLKAYKAPMHKSLVIYNGFDFNRVANLKEKSIIRKEFNMQTKYTVAMVATFSKKKDYKTFILAANRLLKERDDITFLCIGSGDSGIYQQMVPKENINNILFLGRQDNVESIMNVCDLGVLMTNPKHGEGISNAILEFNALGKPVIATSGSGTAEIIEDGVNGLLIKPKSSDELANKILYLIDDKKERLELGEKAKSKVISKFSIHRMIEDFNTIYKEMVS